MAPPVTVQNGQPDSYFVAEVRRILRDQASFVQESPASDGSTGAYAIATAKPIRVQRPPVARQNAYVTAFAASANQPGFLSYRLLFDPAPPIFNPVTTPVISDGGAGGTWAAGVYQILYTYVTASGEFGMSPLSNQLTIAANHQITFGALSGLPSGVTQIKPYVVLSNGGSSVGILAAITVTANATIATTYAGPPTGGNVGIIPALLISDTGELFFPLAPANGTISISYQTFRYSDQQVLDALYEGLDLLWPDIWTPQPFDTTSVLPSPIQWEYQLPVATYGDPRTVITEVETCPPSAFIIFTRISGWRFTNDSTTPTLVFHRPPPTGGTVRLTYVTPYTTLAQLPSIAQMLPVYYAVARLMADQEVMRSRSDDMPALTGENAGAEKGGSVQTASWWLQSMFGPALTKLSFGYPVRRSVMMRAVEKLGLSPLWSSMA